MCNVKSAMILQLLVLDICNKWVYNGYTVKNNQSRKENEMTAEVYTTGKVYKFDTLEDAKLFAEENLKNNGSDIWVGDNLKQSRIRDFKNGTYELVEFNN